MDLSKFQPKPIRAKFVFKQKGINLPTLCRKLEISYSYLSSILNGNITPSPEIVERIDAFVEELEAE